MPSPLHPRTSDPLPRWLFPAMVNQQAAVYDERRLYSRRTIWVDADAPDGGDGSKASPFNSLDTIFASDHLECVCQSLCRDFIDVRCRGVFRISAETVTTTETETDEAGNIVSTVVTQKSADGKIVSVTKDGKQRSVTATALDGRGRNYAGRLRIGGWASEGTFEVRCDVPVSFPVPPIVPFTPEEPNWDARHPRLSLDIAASAVANLAGVYFRDAVFTTQVTGGIDKSTIEMDAHGNNAPSGIVGGAEACAASALANCVFDHCAGSTLVSLDLDPGMVDIPEPWDEDENPGDGEDDQGKKNPGWGGGGIGWGDGGGGGTPGWGAGGGGQGEDEELPGWSEDGFNFPGILMEMGCAAFKDIPRAVFLNASSAHAEAKILCSTPSGVDARAVDSAQGSLFRDFDASAKASVAHAVGTPHTIITRAATYVFQQHAATVCASATAVRNASRSTFQAVSAVAEANASAVAPLADGEANAKAIATALRSCPLSLVQVSDLQATAVAAASGGKENLAASAQCPADACGGSRFEDTAHSEPACSPPSFCESEMQDCEELP